MDRRRPGRVPSDDRESVGKRVELMCLALASVLDGAVLTVAGALFVAAILVAREGWLWHGDLRRWLASIGLLAAVAAVADVISAAASALTL